MLTYFGLFSCLVVLVCAKEAPAANRKPAKAKDLAIVESQEHNFLEAPSYRSYQQNNNAYNEEGASAPEPYMFNYDIQDNDNNKQFRKEESNGNAVKGSYGYVDASGLYRTVEYTADSEYGFRAKVRTNEPGMDAYYLDNGKGQQNAFPADVILEVAESPRGLQYSSSDQVANNDYYSADSGRSYHQNYAGSKGRTNYQQFSEPDQYAASNVDSQQFGRSLAYDSTKSEHKNEYAKDVRSAPSAIKWNSNWNTAKPGSFDAQNDKYQSAYSDGHPVYVDSNSDAFNLSKNRNSKRHLISSQSTIGTPNNSHTLNGNHNPNGNNPSGNHSPNNSHNLNSHNPNSNHKLLSNHNLAINHNSPASNRHLPASLDLVEMTTKVMPVVRSLKFGNKTSVDSRSDSQQKLLSTNLQLEKPMQQFRSLQHYRPFNEIRQKFVGRSPRRYTGFANDLYK